MKSMANLRFQISSLNSGRAPQSETGCKPILRRGFTLVELLVVITIIALLAGVMLGALAKTREAARGAATKATIAKLNDLVLRKYESYLTRRLPVDLSTKNLTPVDYAVFRMNAIRDLMRMEMPDRWCDIQTGSLAGLPSPSLQRIYQAKLGQAIAQANKMTPPRDILKSDHQQAKCLYLWVMTAIPEAKGTFSSSEIGINFDGDGMNVFIDGWGNPIGFLRWAPGATVLLNSIGAKVPGPNGAIGWSDIQIDDTPNVPPPTGVSNPPPNPNIHHDPFDPNFVENKQQPTAQQPKPLYPRAAAYHLYPLIFAGVLSKANGVDDYGIALGNGVVTGDCNVTAPTTDPFDPSGTYAGSPAVGAMLPNGGVPAFHNHHMEQK